MPRLDGTGPMGEGPMTGWGMGYCAVSGAPASIIGRRRGRGGGYGRGYNSGYGRGRGAGRGFGRGYGRGRGFGPGFGYGYRQEPPYYQPMGAVSNAGGQMSPEEETRYLEEELGAIEEEKKDILAVETEIKNRIKELKK